MDIIWQSMSMLPVCSGAMSNDVFPSAIQIYIDDES